MAHAGKDAGAPGAAPSDCAAPQPGLRPRVIQVVLFSTGFVSMAMEVVWIRAFVPVIKTQVYSFALVVASYLLATFLGAALYRRHARRQTRLPASTLLALLCLAAFLPVLANDPRLVHASSDPESDPASIAFVLLSLWPFCDLLGYLTPSLVNEYAAGAPAAAGRAYALNVVGCILGPLFASYDLLPWVSERSALMLLSLPLFAGYFLAAPLLLLFGVGTVTALIGNGHSALGESPSQVVRTTYGYSLFADAVKVADYLQAHSPADARIAVIGSEPEIYFYARRRSATGYIYVYALLERQPFARRMQEEMIAEIERARPEWVVYVDDDFSWLRGPDSEPRLDEWWQHYAATNLDLVTTFKSKKPPSRKPWTRPDARRWLLSDRTSTCSCIAGGKRGQAQSAAPQPYGVQTTKYTKKSGLATVRPVILLSGHTAVFVHPLFFLGKPTPESPMRNEGYAEFPRNPAPDSSAGTLNPSFQGETCWGGARSGKTRGVS